MPSPRLFSPKSPDHEVLWDRFGLARAALSQSQDRRFVTLAVDFVNLRYEDMFKNATFQYLGDFGSGTLDFWSGLNGSKSSFFTLLIRLTEYTHKRQVVGSTAWRSALLPFLLSLERYGNVSKVSISLIWQTDVDEEQALWAYNGTAASAGAQSVSFRLLERKSSQDYECRIWSRWENCMC